MTIIVVIIIIIIVVIIIIGRAISSFGGVITSLGVGGCYGITTTTAAT
jgi:hypothetical protein